VLANDISDVHCLLSSRLLGAVSLLFTVQLSVFNDDITDVLCTSAIGDCTFLLCFHAGT